MPTQNQTPLTDDDIYDEVTDLVSKTSLEQVLAALVRYVEDYRDDDLSQIPAREKRCAQKLINQLNKATDTAEELSVLFESENFIPGE